MKKRSKTKDWLLIILFLGVILFPVPVMLLAPDKYMKPLAVFYVVAVALIMWILPFFYAKFGFMKRFYHDYCGWHLPDESTPEWTDGCSNHAVCKFCKKEIMQDSQGNWFC